jgi:hypothetical protein
LDRFFRGLTAGIIGGIAMNLWSALVVNILKFKITSFIDWAGVILYGYFPRTHFQGFLALIFQILWTGLLGIFFAYLIRFTTSKGYLIKGAYYGILMGFIFYAIPDLLATPYLSKHSTATVLSNHTGGLIWGLIMAQTLRWLDKRVISEATERERISV